MAETAGFYEGLCIEKHRTLEERMAKIEQILEEVRNRPSWLVLAIISVLGTACGAMLMYIITGHAY